MDQIITLPHLRTLVGLRVRHQGMECLVVEVLDTPPSLVLQPDLAPRLMPDQFGRPYEYAVATVTLPVLTDDLTGLNDALLDLEILD
jgi:hypothetical protein